MGFRWAVGFLKYIFRIFNIYRNPANQCTRPTTPSQFLTSNWISGPMFLQLDDISATEQPELFNDLPETVCPARFNIAEISDDYISDEILTRNRSWDLSIRAAKFINNSIHVLVDAFRFKSCENFSNRSCISYEDAKNFLLYAQIIYIRQISNRFYSTERGVMMFSRE